MYDILPRLSSRVPVAELGVWPTPVDRLGDLARAIGREPDVVYVKRDDLTSPVYGGNKVRTLEVLFGLAKSRGARRVYSTGAFGSNHCVAAALHAPRVGLEPCCLLFPQPYSAAAIENVRVSAEKCATFVALPHWSSLPFGIAWTHFAERRRGERSFVMVPGGATPEGAVGYVAAAFELARQVARAELPKPDRVVIGVGSTCTSAGLLVGFTLAARLGIGFTDTRGRPTPPHLVSVRVTPWPVTSAFRIVGLAVRTSRLLSALTGDATLTLEARDLRSRLSVDGRFLGRGYGHPSETGLRAIRTFHDVGGPELDTTYGGKSAACFLDILARRIPGVTLYWATKSTAPLPEVVASDKWPRKVRTWVARAERELTSK
jgi:D-cysteine desulfhydrase